MNPGKRAPKKSVQNRAGNRLVVGQRLWYVPSSWLHREPYEVTVWEVGRKWARIGAHSNSRTRLDIATLVVDSEGHTSPARCYLSKQEYDAKLALEAAWEDLLCLMKKKGLPEGVTLADIEAARQLLKLED